MLNLTPDTFFGYFWPALVLRKLWSFNILFLKKILVIVLSKAGFIHQEELAEISYQMCRASNVLAFGVTDKGDVFLPDFL